MCASLAISVPLFSTENKEKIKICISNLLGVIPEFEERKILNNTLLEAQNLPISGLEKFFNYIRKVEILDAVRYCAILDFKRNSVVLNFHKQALFAKKFAVITADTSSPLGNVELSIKGKNPEKILDWLAPQTVEGRETRRIEFNEINNL
ncbi:MAG: hypothetical protein HGN29_05225 [Asgard group archaeon]|nr:hypothetical protein [Asgard group archaeon]